MTIVAEAPPQRQTRRRDPESRLAPRAIALGDRLRELDEEAARLRAERDAVIRQMHAEERLTPPQIGRALGLSTSLIRLTLH